jgi:hypothetical protein
MMDYAFSPKAQDSKLENHFAQLLEAKQSSL